VALTAFKNPRNNNTNIKLQIKRTYFFKQMSQNNNNQENEIEEPIFISLPNEINKVNKPQLILELNKRNLNSVGTVAELKNRLLKYLNGESCPDDFVTINENYQTKTNKMESKKLYFKPDIFSDSSSDSIDAFLKKYQRAASINGWSEQEKLQFIPAFLEGPALTFYENIENQNFNKWADLEKQLRNEFEHIAHKDMLRLLLEKRKQLDDELPMTFINEIESLCRRIDSEMAQQEITRHIMNGLKPNITRYIGILDNSTLKLLKDNIRKYEMVEFMVTGEINQSPSEIKTDIITHKLNQISNEINEKINLLNENNNKFKTDIENIINPQVQNNNSNMYNNFKNNRQSFSNNKINTKKCEICSKNNHITEFCYFKNKNTSKNNNKIQCTICNRNNHFTENCRLKKNPINCQLCDMIGHSAITCRKFSIQKN